VRHCIKQIDTTDQICEDSDGYHLPVGRRFREKKFLLIEPPVVDFQPILSGGETVKKHLYLLLSLVVLASMMLTACGGAAPATEAPPAATEPASTEPAATEPAATEAPAGSGIAVITYVQQPTTLNPMYANQWFSTITTQFYLKSLWSFDPDNNPVPEIAV
jgi:hypothetical protein